MNGRERILKALARSQPDRVPYWELSISPTLIQALYGALSYEEFVLKEDWDGICVGEDWSRQWIASDRFYDHWGILWHMAAGGSCYPLQGPLMDKRKIDMPLPDPDAPERYARLRRMVERFKGEKAIVFIGHEAFEYSHYLVGGLDKLLLDYILAPAWVEELAEFVWSYQARVLANAAALGADILLTGDDYAGRNGPLVSPEHFQRFIWPYLEKAVRLAHSLDKPFIKHCDGRWDYILPLMVAAGVDAVHPVEPMAGMDIGEIKQQYGQQLALVGNVDCGALLCHASPELVVAAVKETIAKAAPGGGYIISSSNSLHAGVSPANYRAMRQAIARYGAYPLDPDLVKEYRQRDYMAQLR